MKKLLRNAASLVLTLFFLASVTKAQNVPSKVKEAFAKKFPNAQQVEWGKENATEFEAEFTISGTHLSANFDPEGNWKETEVEISHNDLPMAVQQTLKNDYSEAEIKHMFKVTQPDQTLYEVAVANKNEENNEENEEEENENEKNEQGEYGEGRNTHELVFTADGKLVKKEGVGEEED
ncbi:MAG TPA: PepSY-like domain-containing protein [Balneolaceae bacterium]|nr:PepSY-like domain-containing protein [Balneolaceae bacterium]